MVSPVCNKPSAVLIIGSIPLGEASEEETSLDINSMLRNLRKVWILIQKGSKEGRFQASGGPYWYKESISW
jgi:hypothetical protein